MSHFERTGPSAGLPVERIGQLFPNQEYREPVCLITPPSSFLLDERVFMTLGILKVAAALESKGQTVEMLDLSGIENYTDAARDHARASRARCFGITATTPQLPAAVAIARALRESRPDAKIILGGPHITLVSAARKRELSKGIDGRATKAFVKLQGLFDVLVAGDGEGSIFQAIRDDSASFVDADDPRGELFLKNSQLSTLPMPARHLVDVSSYHYQIDGTSAVSMIAQLGCPFGCGFCGGRESPMLRRVRMRSVDSIIGEMVHLHRTYGFNGFMLYDDELNVNPKFLALLQAISDTAKSLNTAFSLRGFIKAELFNDAQAEAMYKAGFRWILTGFEAASPRILKNINKNATLEENTRCFEIARRHNLKVKALMSVGHPGESRETMADTKAWLMTMRPDDFDISIITTYPGTPYYDHAVPHETEPHVWVYTVNGDRLYSHEVDYTSVADYYKGAPDGGYKSFVYTDHISAEEIVRLRDEMERDLRAELKIPFNPSAAAIRYEHSMGQFGGGLPEHILRRSEPKPGAPGETPVLGLVQLQSLGQAAGM